MTNSAIFAGVDDDQLNSLFQQYQAERNRRACLTAAVEDRRISQINSQSDVSEESERPVVSEFDSELSDDENSVNELFRNYQETREEDHSDAIANVMEKVDAMLASQSQTATEQTPATESATTPSLLSRVFNAPGNALDKVGEWFTGGTSRWMVPAGATAAALVAFVTVTNVQEETPAWQQVADTVSVPGFSEFIEVAPANLLDSGPSFLVRNMGFSASRDEGYQAFVGGKVIATLAGSLHTQDVPQIKAVLGSMQDVYSLPKADDVLSNAATLRDAKNIDAEGVSQLLTAISAHHDSAQTKPVYELGVWTVVARQAIDARLAGVDSVPVDEIIGALPQIAERVSVVDKISSDKKAVLSRASIPADTTNADQLRDFRNAVDSIDAVFAM